MKWIFENRVYSSLEELSGKTFNENNQPKAYFTLKEMKNVSEWPFPLEIYLTKKDRELLQSMYKLMSKKNDVGEGAESESELKKTKAMNVKVTGCNDCPFIYDWMICKNPTPIDESIEITEDLIDFLDGGSPNWCPLNKEPITIEKI